MVGGPRDAVVILGMHRSGTSAFAGTAVRLGLASPRTPLPASDDNPDGFYEAVPVAVANHRILLSAGCTWNVCLTFEPDRLRAVRLSADPRFFQTTLESEFGETAPFVLKDPRLCLTLPAWLPALHAMGAAIRALIVLRHPADVARSLQVRNQLHETSTAPHWLHHMLEAERASRGLHRSVVRYDDLLRNWRLCMGNAGRVAGIAWPRPIEAVGSDIDAFLAPSQRQQAEEPATAVIGPAPVCDMINEAWNALRHLAGNPEAPGALASLDRVRARFADWRRTTFPPGYRAVLSAS